MEYIADRVDTDDPVWGFTVRERATGVLQGFVTMTTFTTWHSSFQWDSLSIEAGVRHELEGGSEDIEVRVLSLLGFLTLVLHFLSVNASSLL